MGLLPWFRANLGLLMRETRERIESVVDGKSASELLRQERSPSAIRAIIFRADELLLKDVAAATEVASAALEALGNLSQKLRRPRLLAQAWSVFGSCCRAAARFEEAELALTTAARLISSDDDRGRVDIALRMAVLRAEEKKEPEARELIQAVLQASRTHGGRQRAEHSVSAAGIFIALSDFRAASHHLEEALTVLPANGNRFHLAAVYQLARCRLELASTPGELQLAAALVRKASRLAEPGSLYELRLIWMNGNLLRRLERYDESLAALEHVRDEIEQRGDAFDRALLLLDLAELHLERDDPRAAREVALSSFGVLSALRNRPDAFRALKILHRSATEVALDLPTLETVRSALLEAR